MQERDIQKYFAEELFNEIRRLQTRCDYLREKLVTSEMQCTDELNKYNDCQHELSILQEQLANEKEQAQKKQKFFLTTKQNLLKKIQLRDEKIARMQNYTSMRLGHALLDCRSFRGVLKLPRILLALFHERKRAHSSVTVAKTTENLPVADQTLLRRVSAMPESNGCRYYEKSKLRIGIICDEIFFNSIKNAAEFVYVTPTNWREKLDEGFDAFFYVSAWHGIHMEWKGTTSLGSLEKKLYNAVKSHDSRQFIFNESLCSRLEREIITLLGECRKRHIPTVFYSKEDPPNFWLFLDISRHCDYVFTSAMECQDDYEKILGRGIDGSISFFINPLLHNPIGRKAGKGTRDILFSGSWMTKYPERCRDLAKIFDGILSAGFSLSIFDRNYPANVDRYRYPKKYFSHVLPAVSHDVLQKVHKTAAWAVNVNSVKNSQTMFAGRTFELLASGTVLLSNYSVGMNSLLPDIFIVLESAEAGDILCCYSQEELYERQIAGIRSVMSGHTCFDRLQEMLRPTGLHAEQPHHTILVLADEVTEHVRDCFARQTYADKKLIRADDVTEEEWNACSMAAWFSPQSDYEEFYLEDMANAFKYTACDYIVKDAWFNGSEFHAGVEHGYVDKISGKYRALFWRAAFRLEDILQLKDGTERKNGYAIDHFNFNEKIMTQPECANKTYKLSVIVPVYNNGAALYGKCFASLRRSSIFQDMEIMFVDDGSSDSRTLAVEHYLARHYANIRLFIFPQGGSGSASRPRNMGVTMATAPYVTFLDPDNEAVGDAYAKLLEKAVKLNSDITLGNMYKCDVSTRLCNNYDKITKAFGMEILDENTAEHILQKTNFMAVSIQAMVIRRSFLQENGLKQVEGAVGEDTLFAWQLLRLSRKTCALNLPVHIYYGDVPNSTTNSLGIKFFHKLLLVQGPKSAWLVTTGLMPEFMDTRYDYYTTAFVFECLSRVAQSEVVDCVKLVRKIHAFYEPYYRGTSQQINDFLDACDHGRFEEAWKQVSSNAKKLTKSLVPSLKSILTNK